LTSIEKTDKEKFTFFSRFFISSLVMAVVESRNSSRDQWARYFYPLKNLTTDPLNFENIYYCGRQKDITTTWIQSRRDFWWVAKINAARYVPLECLVKSLHYWLPMRCAAGT